MSCVHIQIDITQDPHITSYIYSYNPQKGVLRGKNLIKNPSLNWWRCSNIPIIFVINYRNLLSSSTKNILLFPRKLLNTQSKMASLSASASYLHQLKSFNATPGVLQHTSLCMMEWWMFLSAHCTFHSNCFEMRRSHIYAPIVLTVSITTNVSCLDGETPCCLVNSSEKESFVLNERKKRRRSRKRRDPGTGTPISFVTVKQYYVHYDINDEDPTFIIVQKKNTTTNTNDTGHMGSILAVYPWLGGRE